MSLFLIQKDLDSLIDDFEIPRIFWGVDITELHLKRIITTDKFCEWKFNSVKKKLNELKKETKPKIKITQEKYNKIKSYILSENSNAVLSLNNLLPEDRVKINNIKQELINDLEYSKNYFRPRIDEFQNKCDEYTSQINEIVKQIPPLQKQLQPKEAKLETQNKEIDKLKFKKQQKQTQLQTQGQTTYKNSEIDLIQNEIYQLQDETIELVGQIDNIKIQIAKLKSKQTMYENMLSRAQEFKNRLQKDLNKRLEQNKQSVLSSLNSLYEINPNEG
ncbi:hypothetical protein [Poinsettia branch-inducing phytoplasma]|uniref:hypothetical protein n=1 Tax=Poinsettia branch-inducing phytoplasma TaxID=138647 RepID=UPI000371E27E|nr:hypothetical protein [Poinsettia branch-inducing phytoplasma]